MFWGQLTRDVLIHGFTFGLEGNCNATQKRDYYDRLQAQPNVTTEGFKFKIAIGRAKGEDRDAVNWSNYAVTLLCLPRIDQVSFDGERIWMGTCKSNLT